MSPSTFASRAGDAITGGGLSIMLVNMMGHAPDVGLGVVYLVLGVAIIVVSRFLP